MGFVFDRCIWLFSKQFNVVPRCPGCRPKNCIFAAWRNDCPSSSLSSRFSPPQPTPKPSDKRTVGVRRSTTLTDKPCGKKTAGARQSIISTSYPRCGRLRVWFCCDEIRCGALRRKILRLYTMGYRSLLSITSFNLYRSPVAGPMALMNWIS